MEYKDLMKIQYAEPRLHEWKVYFGGDFWGHHGRERAGKEIQLGKQFVWKDEFWHIPAIYTCSKGLVLDFCVQVPSEGIRSFMDKWNLSAENCGTGLSDEQLMRIDAENPLSIRINPKVVVNGRALSGFSGCEVSWIPFLPEGGSPEAMRVIQNYGLDPACGWSIMRFSFRWATKRRPQLKTLSVTLLESPVALPGPHFHVRAPGERIEFFHPITGKQHALTVQEYERREISSEDFDSQDQEYPTHYTAMSFTLSPELPDGTFTVADCSRPDMPRQKRSDQGVSNASRASVSVVLACAAQQTAFGGGKLQPACSALLFEAADDVEWRMVFHEKRRDDVTIKLI